MALFAPSPLVPVATTVALVAGKAVSATNGVHYSTAIQIDSTAPSALYYVHFVQGNGAATPAIPVDGAYAAPASFLHPPIAVKHVSGTPDVFTVDDGPGGATFTGGLCIVLSTTQFTKTAATYLLTDSVVA